MFQFTHPRGVRLGLITDVYEDDIVSIHAPARGATGQTGSLTLGLVVSIHAPARGATMTALEHALTDYVSIHAPARGATETQTDESNLSNVSIHAPARGATAGVGRRLWGYLYRPAFAKVLKLPLLLGSFGT